MTGIFVSHAVADRALAELLVDFLMDGIGVPGSDIFCSSINGHGNPLTYDFNQNMRDQIHDPKLVILLMTPAYMDSQFCLMELGATWAMPLKPLPIVVPPVSFADVTKTIGQIQGWNIKDADWLQQVRETVLNTLGIPGKDNSTFDRRRRRWEIDLPKVLEGLAPSTKAPRSDLDTAQKRVGELEAEVADLANKNAALRTRIKAEEGLPPVAMLIEGDVAMAARIANLLEIWGYVVKGTARTHQEAEEIAGRIRPDLIIAETVLADGSSGIEAVNSIMERISASTVFVTSYPERLLTGQRPEPVQLVTKPFGDDVLEATVRKAHEDLLYTREHGRARPLHRRLATII